MIKVPLFNSRHKPPFVIHGPRPDTLDRPREPEESERV
jgi:hypothetical protein